MYNKTNKKSKFENDKKKYDLIMDDIINYNEIDCKVLYEMVSFFRTYYNI